MKALEINDYGKASFCIDKTKLIPVMELDKESLFIMLNNLFDDRSYYDFENTDEVMKSIKNQVEKEMAKQIITKLKNFSDQVDDIKEDLDAKYPGLN